MELFKSSFAEKRQMQYYAPVICLFDDLALNSTIKYSGIEKVSIEYFVHNLILESLSNKW